MGIEWEHKDVWRISKGPLFAVTVSRHEGMCDDGVGPNRWAVYAYIYPAHPHFKSFDTKGGMFQDACNGMPIHSYCSYFKVHLDDSGNIGSFQVGADYNHLHDDAYTWMSTKEAAKSVFNDAEKLHDWLVANAEATEASK